MAAVLNCWKEVLGIHAVPNDPAEFPGFLKAVLQGVADEMTPIFALEGTGGLGRSLALFLAAQGFVVKEINPVLTDRQRSHTPHREKSDPMDAQAVAKVLVDEFLDLPDAKLDEHAEQLAQLVQHREGMVHIMTQLKNRLHSLLHQQYPHYQSFFADPFCKVALAFWKRYPSPAHLAEADVGSLSKFLRECSRTESQKRATKILKLVSPVEPTAPVTMREHLVTQLVDQIQLLTRQTTETEQKMAQLLREDGSYLTTMTGIDTVMAARIIAEIGDIRRFPSADKLARYAGIAPLERSSGKRTRRRHTLQGQRQLNSAFYYIALTQISVDRSGKPRQPVAYAYYHRKLEEGKPKKSALRCLMRRLCEIIYAMMKRREPYRNPLLAEEPPAA